MASVAASAVVAVYADRCGRGSITLSHPRGRAVAPNAYGFASTQDEARLLGRRRQESLACFAWRAAPALLGCRALTPFATPTRGSSPDQFGVTHGITCRLWRREMRKSASVVRITGSAS